VLYSEIEKFNLQRAYYREIKNELKINLGNVILKECKAFNEHTQQHQYREKSFVRYGRGHLPDCRAYNWQEQTYQQTVGMRLQAGLNEAIQSSRNMVYNIKQDLMIRSQQIEQEMGME
jgi:hypothetical protein